MTDATDGAPPAPQRRWQAPCPNCGAPVAFASASAAFAVCGFCRSTVVREGEALRKIGESAELIEDRSALQLGTAGRYEDQGFTLIGRLQYVTADSSGAISTSWNEWVALFDGTGDGDGRHGWLSEDNDQYVFAFDQPIDSAPAAESLTPGSTATLAGKPWRVASRVQARVHAAQGELTKPPPRDRAFTVVDLRNPLGEVATLDYADPQAPGFAIGRNVKLADLALTNLRQDFEDGTQKVGGRSFACPACGASVEAKLAETKSLTCGNCKSVIDLSSGIGGELTAARQAQVYTPRIALGTTGRIALGAAGEPALDWQIVGFSARMGEADGEQFRWYDYLLYNREAGFAYLADTSEGWVGFRTLTGVPQARERSEAIVEWAGQRYARQETYTASVLYVDGEFYWRVAREQRQTVSDYAGLGDAGKKLSREATDDEVVWSIGRVIPALTIGMAFRVPELREAVNLGEIRPVSGGRLGSWVIWLVVILVILILLSRCGSGGGSAYYYGTGGGSYGGYSSGGGHK